LVWNRKYTINNSIVDRSKQLHCGDTMPQDNPALVLQRAAPEGSGRVRRRARLQRRGAQVGGRDRRRTA
jgi:hypothetical protein